MFKLGLRIFKWRDNILVCFFFSLMRVEGGGRVPEMTENIYFYNKNNKGIYGYSRGGG